MLHAAQLVAHSVARVRPGRFSFSPAWLAAFGDGARAREREVEFPTGALEPAPEGPFAPRMAAANPLVACILFVEPPSEARYCAASASIASESLTPG
jgi:hypothetical protein